MVRLQLPRFYAGWGSDSTCRTPGKHSPVSLWPWAVRRWAFTSPAQARRAGRRRIPAHAGRGPLRSERRAERAPDLGRAQRRGARRANGCVRGIFHPFDHRRGAAVRASSGRAVGQRVGILVAMGGSRRSRAADGACGHRGAEPQESRSRSASAGAPGILSGPKGSDGGTSSRRRRSHRLLDSTSAPRHLWSRQPRLLPSA